MKGVDRLVKRESGSANFGAKLAPCLWRADPSFMNSVTGSGYADQSFTNLVTGSGYVAKCSNILQDKYLPPCGK
jgi:hypothetical protein